MMGLAAIALPLVLAGQPSPAAAAPVLSAAELAAYTAVGLGAAAPASAPATEVKLDLTVAAPSSVPGLSAVVVDQGAGSSAQAQISLSFSLTLR